MLCLSAALFAQSDDSLAAFPPTETENLLGENYLLPEDFGAEWSIVVLSLQREHAELMEEWNTHILDYTEKEIDELSYYQIALIDDIPKWIRNMISGGMRRAVKEEEYQARFFVLFAEREKFLSDFGITDDTEPLILAVRKNGEVVVLARGAFSESSKSSFEQNATPYRSYF